jgi:hypothetical protein
MSKNFLDYLPPEIEGREHERRRAMRSGDVAALASLLHDSLIYVHSSGVRDDKESHLASIASGKVIYNEFAHSELRCAVLGAHTRLISGRFQIEATVAGQRGKIDTAFTAVWVLTTDWQMASWQSTLWPAGRQGPGATQ